MLSALFDRASAAWLWPVLRPRLPRLGALFLLGLASAGLALVPPWLTKLVIDEGLIARDPAALVRWTAWLLAAGALALGLGALASVLHMRASVAMLADLRAALAGAVLGRSPAWRARHQTGELLARLDGDAGEVQQFAFNALLSGAGAVVRLGGGVALLFLLNPRLAALACLIAPVELAFLAWARPRTERLAAETRAERGQLAGRLAEMVAGLPAIQAARGEGAVAEGIARQQGRLNAALIRAQLFGELTRGVPALITALARAAIFLAGGLMVIRGDWQLGALIAFLAYLGFLTGPMQTLLGLWHAQARMRAALARLAGVMAPEAGLAWPAAPRPLPEGGGALVFEGVAVAQGGRVLVEGLDATIPAGAKVRLAGPSGAGKSALLSLLQRHADPAAGRILLDGADLRELGREDLRRAVALVPQRPFVMRGTVAENLALTNPGADLRAMEEVLALTRLAPRLAPQTVLGEDGLTLSGGERQRLCLARALLAPFRVLALDEALSEVDEATVRAIVGAIDDRFGRATRLIVTHGAEAAHGPFDLVLEVGR
ncbi:MAG: ABC transporter ATP-binding protein/permease [Rhodobacteraceae bacterium]|nr:ABC transporter ATP-binding protein/permease [Paracoccaceae bacterium]